jgi:hypothetical protein
MRAISSWIARFRSCVVCGQVLYTHSSRYPHRKKYGTVMAGKRVGHRMSPKHEITLWKRLQTMCMLQCYYLARFIPNYYCLCPGCVNVVELSDMDYAEMIPLLCEHFSTHSSWSTTRTVSYTASVFKLTYPQQNPVAWRNHTMPRKIKLPPQAMLCPHDGLCFIIIKQTAVFCALHSTSPLWLNWCYNIIKSSLACHDVTYLDPHHSDWRKFWNVSVGSAPPCTR